MFINNENIESISIKNFNIFTKNTKKLAIKLKNGTDIRLMARVSEKLIPYQQENFAKFMSRYGKQEEKMDNILTYAIIGAIIGGIIGFINYKKGKK